MRTILVLLVLGRGTLACAQPIPEPPPQPDLQFIMVENEHGKPMRGKLSDSYMMTELWQEAGKRTWMVRKQFTFSNNYPYGPEKPGDMGQGTLNGTPIKLGLRTHLRFALIDCYCTDVFLEVVREDECMRIHLPNAPAERWALLQLMHRRSSEHASPEVFRFQPGSFTYAELANDPAFDRLEAHLAARKNDDPQQPYRDGVWRKEIMALVAYFCSVQADGAAAP